MSAKLASFRRSGIKCLLDRPKRTGRERMYLAKGRLKKETKTDSAGNLFQPGY